MKLMKSIMGLAAIAAAIPYKIETADSDERKCYTLTSLTWKAEYKSATETEESQLSIDLLGGLQETVETVASVVKEKLFTKGATECDFYEVAEVPGEETVEPAEAEEVAEAIEVVEIATETAPEEEAPEAARDAKFDEAVQVALEEGKISTSMLQRKLSIGYSRASKIIAAMEKEGMVAPYDGKNARTVLIGKE